MKRLLLTLLLLGACKFWVETDDRFLQCDDSARELNEGDIHAEIPMLCRPWDSPETAHTAESDDSTVVKAVMVERHVLLLFALRPGLADVHILSTLEARPDTGRIVYQVTVN